MGSREGGEGKENEGPTAEEVDQLYRGGQRVVDLELATDRTIMEDCNEKPKHYREDPWDDDGGDDDDDENYM